MSFDPFDLENVPPMVIKRYSSLFDVEKWYTYLEAETFPTIFFPLEPEEISAILHTYTLHNKKDLSSSEEEQIKGAKKVISHLEDKLDRELPRNVSLRGGAFVRLSTRSPKDAVLMLPALKNELQNELRDIPPGDENADSIAWYCAVIKAMRVKTGKEILDLLLNSSRVHHDLSRWVAATQETPENVFPMNIILREWKFIHPKDEFRAFVYNGHLTAVSQYIDVCFFEELEKHLGEIRRIISKYFYMTLLRKLPFQTCVLDLAVIDGACKVIECNPFFIKTGAALFSWEADKALLTTSPSPFENFAFRIIPNKGSRRAQGFYNVREELENKEKEDKGKGKDKEKCRLM